MKPLNPYNFYEKNGLPYCEDDYHRLFSPKCAGCKQPIKDVNICHTISMQYMAVKKQCLHHLYFYFFPLLFFPMLCLF